MHNYKRFFIKDLILEIDKNYKLIDENYNYIVKVIRQKAGDKIIIANNSGYDFLCQITEVNKNNLTIEVLNKTLNKLEAKVNLTVCQALVKGDKFELILQKITELGATKLIPFNSQFTVVKANENKKERLEKIAIGATRQCGRTKMLNIEEVLTFKNLVNELKEYDLVLLAYEKATNSLKETLTQANSLKNIAIIIGSEGGFSIEEVEFLQSNLTNLKTISMGKRILRADTASIVLTSLVMSELGKLS